MNREQLQQRYTALKRAYEHKQIPEQQFRDEVYRLRFQDEHGAWHQIDAESGRWLRWENDTWVPEPESESATATTQGAAGTQQQLPEGFLPLLGLIIKNTIKMFFKRLPLTVLFAVGALVLHTYLLVYVNNGFDPSTTTGNFLSLANSPLSGIVIWTVGPMLMMSLMGRLRGKRGPGIGARLVAVRDYFRERGIDALAVAMGSLGVALTVGGLMNGHASLFMAAGVGAMVASRSGAVTALLFRSAWTAAFNAARRENVARYGLAAGYVTLFASSLGFIANSVVTPNGVVVGILLLVGAIAMARGAQLPPAATPLLLLGIALFGSYFIGIELLWADDGGFNDPSGGGGRGTWISWWNGTGRNTAIAMGVGPAVGASMGLLFQRVFQDMALQLPPDLDMPTSDLVLDENGNPLERRDDGLYRWDVGDTTEWLTKDEARDRVQEELDARGERDRQQNRFWGEAGTDPRDSDKQDRPDWSLMNRPSTDHDWDHESGQWVHKDDLHQRRMEREGYVFDDDGQAWRKPPPQINRVDVPQEEGDASRIDLKPGGSSWWPGANWIRKNLSYDPSTENMDNRYNQLDKSERDAIDEYKRVSDEHDKAVKSGDKWLADQWQQRKDEAKDQVSDIQRQKDDLTNRVGNRERRTQATEQQYQNWKGKDVVKEAVTLPYHVVRTMVAPDMSDVKQAMQEAIDARNRLQSHMDKAPNLYQEHDRALNDLKSLRDQINQARDRGDTAEEEALRQQAAQVRDRLNSATNQLNQIHDASTKWQQKAPMANIKAYQAGTQMIMDGTGVAGTSKAVNNLIDNYRRGNLPGQYANRMSMSGDPNADLPGFSRRPNMDADDMKLHQQTLQNRLDGARNVATWDQSHMQGKTPEDIKKATIDVVENRQSKLQMKDAPSDIQKQYAHDVWENRTKPLFQETAAELNNKGAYVIENGVKRPVEAGDFTTGSGPGSKGPGMDVDMFETRTIYNADGTPVKPNTVNQAIDGACDKLNFNRHKQEIHYMHKSDPEAYRLKPGTDPKTHLSPENVKKWDASDGELGNRITQHKPRDLEGMDAANKLEETCRGGMKDYNRITKNLSDEHFSSKVPQDLKRAAVLMDDVNSGRRTVGEANSLSKQELGMDLNEAANKLSSLQESIIKLDPVPPSRGGTGNLDADLSTGGNVKNLDGDVSTGGRVKDLDGDVSTGGKVKDLDGDVSTGGTVKRFHADMDDVGEMVRRMPEDATDLKVKSAEGMAEQLRRGEVPEDFGKRQIGPTEESKSAWEAWDKQQNLPKRGNTHMDSVQAQGRQEFLEKSGLVEVDSKINKAWEDAYNQKLQDIIDNESANLQQQGISPDSDDFQSMLGERIKARNTEKLDCWDEFQDNIRQMEARKELGSLDYDKWENAIGKYEVPQDMSTGQVPVSGSGSDTGMGTGRAPGFGDRSGDFD